MGEPPAGAHPGIGIIAYDANGEGHARSKEGLGWMCAVEGMEEKMGGMMTVREAEANALAESFRDWQGRNMYVSCSTSGVGG